MKHFFKRKCFLKKCRRK